MFKFIVAMLVGLTAAASVGYLMLRSEEDLDKDAERCSGFLSAIGPRIQEYVRELFNPGPAEETIHWS